MYFNYSGSFDETGSPDVNDGLPPLERDDSSYIPSMATHGFGPLEVPTHGYLLEKLSANIW
jgi:hypothetical protein